MSLSEKLKSVKTGLAVLVAGAMISGIAYAKEINNEGWPLPDKAEHTQLAEPYIENFSCKYQDKTLTVKVKIESYMMSENKAYQKYSFEDQVFMYAIIKCESGHVFHITVLADRDGNGSIETKYTNKEITEELEKEGIIPGWIIKKTIENQKTETN